MAAPVWLRPVLRPCGCARCGLVWPSVSWLPQWNAFYSAQVFTLQPTSAARVSWRPLCDDFCVAQVFTLQPTLAGRADGLPHWRCRLLGAGCPAARRRHDLSALPAMPFRKRERWPCKSRTPRRCSGKCSDHPSVRTPRARSPEVSWLDALKITPPSGRPELERRKSVARMSSVATLPSGRPDPDWRRSVALRGSVSPLPSGRPEPKEA